jgi:methylmalonyl-CoA/ethylmalonyl-CoA epimerase
MAPTIAHLGIAVTDLDAAMSFYSNVLGLTCHGPEFVDGARIVHVTLGASDVELLQPVTPDSPIGRFIARRGPGLHHVCFRVPDLDAALDACRRNGYDLVDEQPRIGAGGCRVAFLHPRSTHGTLIELTE